MADPGPTTASQRHAIAFDGSGSEYFRIWIVNLLLVLLTLTLYYPWAKVRSLRWFHASTRVAGHALDFHGRPLQMLRGYLLVLGLAGAYALAGQVSPAAQGVALLVLALIWPALWRASMQFRLANTSWRGLRLAFTGSLGGAYGALLLPWALLLAMGLAVGLLVAVNPGPSAALVPLLLVLGFYALLPWFWLRLKRYQHGHYAYAQLITRLETGAGAAYRAWFAVAGVAFAVLIGVALLFGLAMATLLGGAPAEPRSAATAVLGFAPLLALLVLLAQVVPRAYATARLQNLLWSGTAAHGLRFHSTLAFAPLAGLLLKNWLLVIVTLGLYWPWAAVAVARRRLEAVSLASAGSLDTLVAGERARQGDAAGDAAGDVFGIDLGL